MATSIFSPDPLAIAAVQFLPIGVDFFCSKRMYYQCKLAYTYICIRMPKLRIKWFYPTYLIYVSGKYDTKGLLTLG